MSILASSLTLGAADYDWRDNAICRDTDPALFFPVGTTGLALVQIDRAKDRFATSRHTNIPQSDRDRLIYHVPSCSVCDRV